MTEPNAGTATSGTVLHMDTTTAETYTTIVNPAAFYRASAEVDVLRDTARRLMRGPFNLPTATILASSYNRIRGEVAAALTSAEGDEVLSSCPELPDVPELPEIVVTTALLARKCDIHLNMPGFLASLAMNSTQLAAMRASHTATATSESTSPAPTGSYL